MERDETSKRRLNIDGGGTQQCLRQGAVLNPCLGWHLEKQSRYPVRHGNKLTPYYSGEEVFRAIAHSIKNAKKSVDMVMWGFDPALPLIRPDGYDNDHIVTVDRRVLPDKSLHYSNWRKSDALGEIILDALTRNPELKVRMVIWHHPFSLMLMQNVVGMGYA
ncbi:MAG: hypothetical protein LBV45_04265, partial [Xanthomonadaceae bacterium]|nr:hypothetical protein [Xanthomonadaceae bacterium]